MAERCRALTKDGRPCSATPSANGWCKWHDPDLAEDRRVWSRRGGEGKSNINRAAKRVPRDLRDVKSTLMEAIQQVAAGEMEPGQANAIANLARAVVAVSGVADFETQLAEMRVELAELADRRGA